jgi:hypothetical protein
VVRHITFLRQTAKNFIEEQAGNFTGDATEGFY